MTDFFERRTSRSAKWSLNLSRFAAVLFVVSVLGHRIGPVGTIAFFWLLGIVAGLIVISLGLMFRGFYRVWEHGDRGGRSLTRSIIYCGLVLVPYAIAGWYVYSLPRLTDVSTDLGDPPAYFSAQLTRSGDMNPIAPIGRDAAEAQNDAYADVTGRRYDASPESVLVAVNNVIGSRRWPVTYRFGLPGVDQEVVIEALTRTFWLGLASDLVVRLTDEGESSYVDLRSTSRYGPHDLGANARRIRFFLIDLDAEVARVGRRVEQNGSEEAESETPQSDTSDSAETPSTN